MLTNTYVDKYIPTYSRHSCRYYIDNMTEYISAIMLFTIWKHTKTNQQHSAYYG